MEYIKMSTNLENEISKLLDLKMPNMGNIGLPPSSINGMSIYHTSESINKWKKEEWQRQKDVLIKKTAHNILMMSNPEYKELKEKEKREETFRKLNIEKPEDYRQKPKSYNSKVFEIAKEYRKLELRKKMSNGDYIVQEVFEFLKNRSQMEGLYISDEKMYSFYFEFLNAKEQLNDNELLRQLKLDDELHYDLDYDHSNVNYGIDIFNDEIIIKILTDEYKGLLNEKAKIIKRMNVFVANKVLTLKYQYKIKDIYKLLKLKEFNDNIIFLNNEVKKEDFLYFKIKNNLLVDFSLENREVKNNIVKENNFNLDFSI